MEKESKPANGCELSLADMTKLPSLRCSLMESLKDRRADLLPFCVAQNVEETQQISELTLIKSLTG